MGTNAEAEVEVILDANGAPVMKAIDNALARMQDIQRVTSLIVNNAKAASLEFQKATQNQLKGFEKALARVESIEKAMQRLSRQPITQANNDRLFAGQIASVAKFNIGLKEATNAAQAFQGRLNDMDRRLVTMGNSGNVSGGLLSRRLGLEQAQKDFVAVQREIERTDRAARRSGISADKSGVLSAENALFGALRQQKVNLGPQLSDLHKAADQYIIAVKAEQARIRKETAEANRPPPLVPTGGGGGGGRGPGLFGATGLTGVVARTAAYGGAAALIFGAVNAMKTGIDEAVKFDDTLHKIAGVAGLTATQMNELGGTIMDVSNNSRFARQEIAEASTVLAQAGFSASDIAVSLKSISDLAASSGSSFAEVTDVMTSAISAFQLNAAQSAQVANQLAAALNMSKLNIQQVALAIQYAGAAAYENNMTFQDLTATLAAMAQAGIRSGSTMGTGIRQLMTDLLTPTKKMVGEMKHLGLTMDDLNVKTNGLMGVIKNLSDAGFGAAEAYRGLEVRAAAAYLALRNQQDVALKVAQAQIAMKAASDGAGKATNSLSAQWQIFKNHVNNAVTQGIEPATHGLTGWLKSINQSASGTRELDKVMADLEKQFAGQADASIKADRALQDYKDTKELLINTEEQHAAEMEKLQTAANKAQESLDHETQVLDSLDTSLTRVAVRKEILTKDSVALATETLNLEGQFQGLAAMLQNTALTYDNLTAALMRYRSAQLGKVMADSVDAYNKNDAIVQNNARYGQTYLNNLRGSGLMKKLPGNVQQAVNDAAHFSGTGRSQSLAIIQDYLASNPKINPNERRLLSAYTSSVGQLNVGMNNRDQAALTRDTARDLMSGEGEKLATQVQGIQTVAQGRAVIKDLTRRFMNAKTPGARNALGQLLQWASSQTSMVEKPSAEPGKAKRPSRAAEHAEERRQLDLARQQQKSAEAALKNSIEDMTLVDSKVSDGPENGFMISKENGLTVGRVKKNMDKVEDNLQSWITSRLAVMNAQIAKDDMGGQTKEEFKAAVMREIQEKKKDTAQAIGEELSKALDAMVKAAEDAAAAASAAADHQLNMSGSRLKSLDRVAARGGVVPDYVRNHYEKLQAKSQDSHDRAQIGINNKEIADLNDALSFNEELQGKLRDDMPGFSAAYAMYSDKIRDTRLQIQQLTDSNEELGASFKDVIPQDFGTQWSMMLEQYKDAHGLSSTLTQDMVELGGKALDQAQGAFTTFFTDVLTGAKSLKSAFGDLVKGIIRSLEQLAAELIAKQIFKLIIGALSGGGGGGTGGGAMWNGGFVKGAWGGEHIQGKIEGRDSVLRKLAPGEFVMRRAAVRSVGVANMHKINEMGANALQAHSMPQAAPVNQQVSVYVVKEGEKPQMGPRDVLVAVHEDILKNGETKKLIKMVSQGA